MGLPDCTSLISVVICTQIVCRFQQKTPQISVLGHVLSCNIMMMLLIILSKRATESQVYLFKVFLG